MDYDYDYDRMDDDYDYERTLYERTLRNFMNDDYDYDRTARNLWTLRKIMGAKFDGDQYLEIDRGRYLAIDDNGRYEISTEPKAIRGKPFGGFEGYPGMRVALGGDRLGDYINYVVDRGDTIDHVSIGIISIGRKRIWISGDKIRHEDEEDEEEVVEREEYFPIMFGSYPKQRPPNISEKQLWELVEKESINRERAQRKLINKKLKRYGKEIRRKLKKELKRSGKWIEAQIHRKKVNRFLRSGKEIEMQIQDDDLSSNGDSTEKVVEESDSNGDSSEKVEERTRPSRKRKRYICWFGKRHICPLITSIARKKRRNH